MPYESVMDRLRRARRIRLKADYEMVRAAHPEADLKPYDDLTPEERAKHEAIFDSTARFFQKLGKSIHDGTPPPNPLEEH
jgi:hypothetical protein